MAASPKPTSLIREEWNHVADSYAQSLVALTSKIYRAMLPFLQLTEVQTVVEAACGPGNGVELLRQHIPPTARVLANDISARFVDMTRGKGYPNVEVVEAVNEALPYPDACADRYVANMSLHHVEFPGRMVSEAFRVLKPGGIAAISTLGDLEKSSMIDVSTRLYYKYSGSPYQRYTQFTESTFRDILQSAGFRNIITLDEMTYFPVLNTALIEQNFLQNPLNEELYVTLDEQKKADFREDLHELMSEAMREHPLSMQGRIAIAFKA